MTLVMTLLLASATGQPRYQKVLMVSVVLELAEPGRPLWQVRTGGTPGWCIGWMRPGDPGLE